LFTPHLSPVLFLVNNFLVTNREVAQALISLCDKPVKRFSVPVNKLFIRKHGQLREVR